MPSQAIQFWRAIRSDSLDEIENAHRAVGGSGRGRRYATQQINRAYAVLLSSHFQGFCRDLHAECVQHFASQIQNADIGRAVQSHFMLQRKLDTGNPNPGNIGSDFGRFDIKIWVNVLAYDPANVRRKQQLEELNLWRNAIAHQDFDPAKLGSMILLLRQVRQWRNACSGLASAFDEVMEKYLRNMTNVIPW